MGADAGDLRCIVISEVEWLVAIIKNLQRPCRVFVLIYKVGGGVKFAPV